MLPTPFLQPHAAVRQAVALHLNECVQPLLSLRVSVEIQRDFLRTQASSQLSRSELALLRLHAVASTQHAANLQLCLCYSPAVLCLPVSVFVFISLQTSIIPKSFRSIVGFVEPTTLLRRA